MLVLRCTRKLLERLHLPPTPADAVSSTVLGDCYATILSLRPAHLVLLVSEASRLPVVLPAKPLSTLLERIPDAIAECLFDLGVSAEAIARERDAMQTIECGPTRSRSVLGAMNEFVFQIRWTGEEGPLPEPRTLSRQLSEVLIGVSTRNYVHPADETRRLLGRELGVGVIDFKPPRRGH